MYRVKDVANIIERLAPTRLAESWDNVGLMVGDPDKIVETIFICLDVTSENVSRAIEQGADLIISHHPLIFSPIKNIVENDILGGILCTLIKNDIAVYSAHTNLDHADGGMNDILADKLGLEDVRRFTEEECTDGTGNPIDNIGRVGYLDTPVELEDFKSLVKSILGCRSIRSLGNPSDTISTVALCTGSGGEGIYSAYHSGADVYVTSDIKHHEAQLAFELGINLIDAGHFETENTICDFLKTYLEENLTDIEVIASDAEPYFS